MAKKFSNLSRFLLTPLIGAVFSSFIVFWGTSWLYFSQSVADNFEQSTETSLNLFSANITNDLMMGLNHEVYRKCQSFLENPNVLSIRIESASGRSICSFTKEVRGPSTFELNRDIYFDEDQTNLSHRLTVEFDRSFINEYYRTSLLISVAILLAILGFACLFLRRVNRRVVAPISKLAKLMSKRSLHELKTMRREESRRYVHEIEDLYQGTRDLAGRVLASQRELIKDAQDQALAKMARQVVHDIRSPITAIKVLLHRLKKEQGQESEEFILLSETVSRINEITNDLHNQYRALRPTKEEADRKFCELNSCLLNVLREKRMEYASREKIEIILDTSLEEFSQPINVSAHDFSRMVSNIINNAVEAIESDGQIRIRVKENKKSFSVFIKDNGKGMTPNVLSKVQEGPYTTRETGGGLGLSHARETLKKVGGKLKIESTEDYGTEVKLLVPKLKPKEPDHLFLKGIENIVSVDDEPFTYRVITESLRGAGKSIEPLWYQNPERFIEDFKQNKITQENTLFLFDQDLRDEKYNGLKLIRDLKLRQNTFLVSNLFDNEEIRNEAAYLGVPVVSKMNLHELKLDFELTP